jgi:hypothetical protein
MAISALMGAQRDEEGGRLDLVPSKLHIIMVNVTEKAWMLDSPLPGIECGLRKRNTNRVTALLVFCLIPMQLTLGIHHFSPSHSPPQRV